MFQTTNQIQPVWNPQKFVMVHPMSPSPPPKTLEKPGVTWAPLAVHRSVGPDDGAAGRHRAPRPGRSNTPGGRDPYIWWSMAGKCWKNMEKYGKIWKNMEKCWENAGFIDVESCWYMTWGLGKGLYKWVGKWMVDDGWQALENPRKWWHL